MTWRPYFADGELRCKCGCGRIAMDEGFMRRLIGLREATGIPMRVASGFRCPAYDGAVGGSGAPGSGPHVCGKAIDMALGGEDLPRLMGVALAMGFTGFGLLQKGRHDRRFIHLDDLSPDEAPRPRIWTY